MAGRFYPGDAESLSASVGGYLGVGSANRVLARMLMVPHAGFVYSGAIAGETFARAKIPPTAIVMCPNHTGYGVRRSLWPSGSWHLPGFDLEVDSKLAASVRESADLTEDHLAHVREHAIEVELPFLHALRNDVKIVPICLAGLSYAECEEVGLGIARSIAEQEQRESERVLVVASSDMSHYISADSARSLDRKAIDQVLALDAEGLYRTVKQFEISMCGYVPTTVALVAARQLGATRAELCRYGNSGETSGNFDEVVGYAGVLVS